MAMIDSDDAHLRALNLGDSGYILLRKKENSEAYETVFRSSEK